MRNHLSESILARPIRRVLCLAVLAVVGCDSSSHRTAIVAVPLTAAGAPMLTERTGIEEAASKAHLGVDWNGPLERNAQWQVDAIQQAVRDRPYGLIVTPYSAFGLNASIRQALAQRIPVVVVAAPLTLPPSPHLSFVLEDTHAGASLISRRLNALLNGRGKIALLGIDPESNGSDQRAETLQDELHRSSPNIQVVARVRGPMSFGYLEISTEQLLREHPDLDAIVTMTARAGTSAAEAIRTVRPKHPVHVLVYDGTFAVMLLLRHHEVDSVLIQNLRGMGNRAVENLIGDHAGRPNQQYVKLPPRLATRENIDSEEIQQMMLQHWEQP